MSNENKLSMFETAHARTLDSIKYLVYQEKVKTDELNHLGQDILENAKFEVFAAQMEQIDTALLSKPAQMLLDNPELAVTNEFRAQLFLDEKPSEFMRAEAASEPEETTIEVEKDEEDVISFDVDEPKQPVTPKTKPVALIKNFKKVNPAKIPEGAMKKYKPAILKPCIDVLYDIVIKYSLEQLENIVSSEDVFEIPANIWKLTIANNVGSVLLAIAKGADIERLKDSPFSDMTQVAQDICDLSYSIIENANEFKEDNPELATGKNLTASNIMKYYRELGAKEQGKMNNYATATGKNVIATALTPDVYEILDDASENTLIDFADKVSQTRE